MSVATASAAVLSLAACGGDEASGSDPSEAGTSSGTPGASSGTASGGAPLTPIPKEKFLEELAKASCEGMQQCCQLADYPYVEGACEETLNGSTNAGAAAALNDPDVTYDALAAAECIALARHFNDACSWREGQRPQADEVPTWEQSMACQRVLTGRKQQGEPCEYGECALVEPTTGFAQTACAPAAKDAPATCQSLVLQTQVGAPCDPLDSGNSSQFVSRRVCYVTEAGLATLAQGNDEQVDPYQLQLRVYEETLLCRDGSCQRYGDVVGRLNGPCGDDDLCEVTADCRNGTCVARVGEGQSCAEVECTLEWNCDDTTKICTVRKANGAACTDEDECSGGECVNGRCSPPNPATRERCGGATDASSRSAAPASES